MHDYGMVWWSRSLVVVAPPHFIYKITFMIRAVFSVEVKVPKCYLFINYTKIKFINENKVSNYDAPGTSLLFTLGNKIESFDATI